MYLLHHTETLENYGPGSLDEGGFSNQPTEEHFNLPGHQLYHLKVSVLEKVWDHGKEVYLKYENLNTSEIL